MEYSHHEEAIAIITILPDKESAAHLARTLVDQRLAACVTILPASTSVYRWQGVIETTQETPLLIKTLKCHYHKVETVICHHHPYELPEIIAVSIVKGLPAYLEWMAQETRQPT